MKTIVYSGRPTTVCIEASEEAIMEHNLDTWENEHYDWVKNCISIEREDKHTTFETTRSIEAFRAGEPNAGRFVLTIENRLLERIIINKEDQQ